MRVTYYSAQGAIRMVYLNVASYYMKGSSIVELLSVERWQDTVNGKAVKDANYAIPNTFCCYDSYHTMALVNLAPGEYLEWGNDAERS